MEDDLKKIKNGRRSQKNNGRRTSFILFKLEWWPYKKMEDDLKKIKMEDDLKKIKNGRQPQKKIKNERQLKFCF